MEGGLFLADTGWEFLLPEGIRQMRSAGEVCTGHWDLLALTPAGRALLAGTRVAARVLLLPGDCAAGALRAERVVTYGLSPRDSITLSSLSEPVLCVQRALPLLHGGVLEPQEFPLSGATDPETMLPCVSLRLLWTGTPYMR